MLPKSHLDQLMPIQVLWLLQNKRRLNALYLARSKQENGCNLDIHIV